jgi:hypothetical protein
MSAGATEAEALLAELRGAFEKQRIAAERAMAQVDDEAFFATLGEDENSIAIIAKHMSGNLRSRFRDFLTSDGEKPDRDRDGEFEVGEDETRARVMTQWASGWSTLDTALRGLSAADLARTVYIRGEGASVLQALLRALAHQAQHAGQIVLLARHLAGTRWHTLSIPRRPRR